MPTIRFQSGKLLSDSAVFHRAGVHFLHPWKAGPQGPCQTQGRGARVCSRQEEGESRYGSRPIGGLNQAALWDEHSKNAGNAWDEKKRRSSAAEVTRGV